jgi:hypothetical protein
VDVAEYLAGQLIPRAPSNAPAVATASHDEEDVMRLLEAEIAAREQETS